MARERNGYTYVGVIDNGAPVEWVIKTLQIGTWDMDATATKTVAHGLSATEWPTVQIISTMIIVDGAATVYPLVTGEASGYHNGVGSTNISLARTAAGTFDNTAFNDGVINRGYVTFMYVADSPGVS